MSHPPPSAARSVAVLAAQFEGATDPLTQAGVAARLRAVVEESGGRLEASPPEFLLAFFGTPHGDEEDAGRAARAGLRMAREAPTAPGGRATAVKLGLHFGEVRWPEPGADRTAAFSELTAEARRLAALAPPGVLLASPPAERAAASRVRFRQFPHGNAAEALGEVDTRQSTRELPRTPTVGRDEEMARMMEVFDRGTGGFLLLEGDAGVGKSRLAYEFRRRISERGTALVASGRAFDGPQGPLGVFGDIVRAAVGITGLDPGDGDRVSDFVRGHLEDTIPDDIERENCTHLIALSVGLAPTGVRVAHMEPARMRSETQYAWVRWLRAHAARQPILICLEDLQWADDATIGLLESLVAGLSGEPVLFLGTKRPSAKTPRGCERLRIAELPREATLALAEAILRAPLSAELGEFLVQQTGGHPYYLEELVRYLDEAGLVFGSPMALLHPPDRLPDGLHGLLVARIQSLGVEEAEVLKAASVFGLTFWGGLLERALFRRVDRPLDRSRRRQIVISHTRSLVPGEEELAFRHALLRDAAYSLLAPSDRARLHRVAADLLLPYVAAGGRRVRSLVAAHREAAGQREEPARLMFESAREALRDSAYVEALGHAAEALRLGHGPAARLIAGRALVRLARLDEAMVEALAVSEASDASAEEIAHAKLLLAEIYGRRGDQVRFLALVEDVEAAQPPGPVLIDTLSRKARVLWGLGRHEDALACVAEVRRRLEALPKGTAGPESSRVLADTWSVEGLVRWRQGNAGEAAACYTRALEVAQAVGDRLGAATALNSMGALHRDQHEDALARHAFEQAVAILREIGDRIGYAAALANLGLVLRETGDLSAAAVAHRESIAIFRQAGDAQTVARGLKALSDVLIDGGAFAEAVDVLAEGTALAKGDRGAEMLVQRNLGQALAAVGGEKQGRKELESALERARALGGGFNIAWILLRLSDLHQDAGRASEARDAAAEAYQVATQNRLVDFQITARLAQARALADSDPGAALGFAREALAAAVPIAARGREAAALFLLVRLEDVNRPARLARAGELAAAVTPPLDRWRLAEDEGRARRAIGDMKGAILVLSTASESARTSGAIAVADRLDALGQGRSRSD